jgi:hypothetical protein
MAEQKPNDPSSKSKAEGERWSGDGREHFDQSGATQSGITNRPLDEEITNQESVPPRGKSQPGAHTGRGGDSSDERSRDR